MCKIIHLIGISRIMLVIKSPSSSRISHGISSSISSIGISRIIECIDIVCIEPYRIDSG
jgi:hypothetical protein